MQVADVLGHPENARVLRWLGVDPARARLARWDQAQTGYEPEGASYLFDTIAGHLPADTKWALSAAHVLIDPDSAVIFGLLHGRFTFLLRRPRTGDGVCLTLDGTVDARPLGPGWDFYEHEDELEDLDERAVGLDAGRVVGAWRAAAEESSAPVL